MQTVRSLASALVVLAWLFASPGAAQHATLRPTDRSVLRILAMYSESNYGIGTGFFVDDTGTIVTAAHVVADARVLVGISAVTGAPFPLAVAALDSTSDVAIVRAPAGVAPAHIALSTRVSDIAAGAEITVSGYSGGELREIAPAVTVGHVSRTLSDGSMELSATVNPGQSGGPVLTSSGELLGLLSARADPHSGVIGVALIRPRTSIMALLDHAPAFTVSPSPSLARLIAFGANAVTLPSLTASELESALAEAHSTHERAVALLAGEHYADSPDTTEATLVRFIQERCAAIVATYPHLVVLYPSLTRVLVAAP